MRLPEIERGRGLGNKALFALIRVLSRHRAPDVVRTLRFERHLFGEPMNEVFQAVMRGPSEWTVGERELFAAWVSKKNECEF
ncbi:MAG: hypothetical protein HS111_06165 [Kofleriaceae bacterium]|nr:hypothetical protein [Kofleriaceae bacterium]MCL4223906.1 hypothetical protein [Myxococcales bacterium]